MTPGTRKPLWADWSADTLQAVILVVALAAVSLTFQVVSGGQFLSSLNIQTVAFQSAFIAILAFGMSVTFISGGIDLSMGSVGALAGAVAAWLVIRDFGALSILGAVLVGFLAGVINAALIVHGRLPPFIATLATGTIARSLVLVVTNGQAIAGFPAWFIVLGSAFVGPVPVSVLVALVVFVVIVLVLRRTRSGAHVYAVGGDPEVARLAGVSLPRTLLAVYVVSGLAAALYGFMITGFLQSAHSLAGVGVELDAVAAAALGGISLYGGRGRLQNVVLGALLIGVIANGLNVSGVDAYLQQVFKGVILVVAVTADVILRARPLRAVAASV